MVYGALMRRFHLTTVQLIVGMAGAGCSAPRGPQ